MLILELEFVTKSDGNGKILFCFEYSFVFVSIQELFNLFLIPKSKLQLESCLFKFYGGFGVMASSSNLFTINYDLITIAYWELIAMELF